MNVPPLRRVSYCSRTADMILDSMQEVGRSNVDLERLTNGWVNARCDCVWRPSVPNKPHLVVAVWETWDKHLQWNAFVNGKIFSKAYLEDLVDSITTELLESGIINPQ